MHLRSRPEVSPSIACTVQHKRGTPSLCGYAKCAYAKHRTPSRHKPAAGGQVSALASPTADICMLSCCAQACWQCQGCCCLAGQPHSAGSTGAAAAEPESPLQSCSLKEDSPAGPVPRATGPTLSGRGSVVVVDAGAHTVPTL